MSFKEIPFDGKPIAAPGLYKNVPIDWYHSARACAGVSTSSSELRMLHAKSPKHAFAVSPLNPNRAEDDDRPHFTMGRAVHHLMLGQPHFAREFVVQPAEIADENGVLKPWHGGRTICKAWLAEAAKAGKTVLAGKEVEHIKGMALSLGTNPFVRAGILTGLVERTIVYRDDETGMFVKVRPDAIPTASADFSDLKTTTSVQWIDMMRTISDYGYHMQAALIRTAAEKVLKIERRLFTFSLVFIEKTPPYCCRVVQLKPDDLDMGEQENRLALNLFADCVRKKEWPGPGEGPEATDDVPYIDLTDWYRERAKARIKRLVGEPTTN